MESTELILNRYRPLGEAGRGGFGTVQIAWDTRIQRRVAVKCMPLGGFPSEGAPPWVDPVDSQDSASAESVEDLLRAGNADIPGLEEARTAALLQAPNIVGVLDFEVKDSTAYLIMEYVDGITLAQLLRDCGDRVDADIVAAVFDGVANALATAHENAVLHLDIKPDNILINHQGLVKVTDFGLSELSSAAGFDSAAGGTIGYMPPEQMDRGALDERCDEWALASVVYEMIAGENPFWAKDIPAAQRAITDAELVLPHLCMPDLGPEVDDVLFYALDPDRDERYESVRDFAEVLLPLLGDARSGTKKLAHTVAQAIDDERGEEELAGRVPLLERLGLREKPAFMRAWSTVGAGLLSFASLQAVPQLGGLGGIAFWGALALIVLAAALVPHVGAVLALAAFSIALFASGAVVPGALLLAGTCAWWLFSGRRGMPHANTAMAPVVLGCLGMGNAAPLLAGYFLPVRDALITTGMTALLALLLTAGGAQDISTWNAVGFQLELSTDYNGHLLAMLSLPQTYLSIAAWLSVAAISAVCCTRGTLPMALLGWVASALVMVAMLLGNAYLAVGDFAPSTIEIGRVAVPLVLSLVLIFVGIPVRED
ncbi:serine/threonine-protein kinase [Curtanaerobium respiraculi]|uniref:serine/threonine-protein kinase n=1 Tax=Curtanaerobium respiraculi TaxID=2949669 RepID=UPI0024B379D4|nr:serine/threonine-protein kinase [Curtanaerobium respiraculi]